MTKRKRPKAKFKPRVETKSAKSSGAKPSARSAGRKSTPGTFTPQKRAEFLERYAGGGTVAMCASKIGVSASIVFRTARNDPRFAKALEAARETNTDHVEDGVHHLAVAGNLTAMFGILRARRPHVWRDNSTVRVDAGDGFAAAFAAAMNPPPKTEDAGGRAATQH